MVQQVDLAVSGRYDHYNILGNTTNPKISADWHVTDGLKFRGTYSTSFVAPPQTSIGDPSQNYLSAFSSVGASTATISFPTANYPGTAGVLPGCAANATTCNLTAATPGFSTLSGIGANAKPYKGKGWTAGVDFTPTFLPGLRGSLTRFNTQLEGVVQTLPATQYTQVPALNQYLTICPTGCSAAFVAEKTAGYSFYASALANPVYYYVNNNQKNVLNIRQQGLDISSSYDFPLVGGNFTLGGSATYFLKYDLSFGTGVTSPWFSVLNTSGQTGTFPQVQLQGRVFAGWSNERISAKVFANFTGEYKNWGSNTVLPITRDAAGFPTGGGDPVESNVNYDLNVSYNLPDGMLGGDHQIFFNVTNLLDNDPPFYNAAPGNDDFVSNRLGRVMSAGVRMKF